MQIMQKTLVMMFVMVSLAAMPALSQTTPAEGQPQIEKVAPEKNTSPTSATTGEAKKDTPGPQNPFDTKMLLIFGAVILLFFFMNSRSRRKQEAKRKEMLSQIQRGAKVTTIGGVMGTVVDVRDEDVTVKVDESNNVKIRFARWAIRGVGEGSAVENPDQKK